MNDGGKAEEADRERSARPLVALPRAGLPGWVIAAMFATIALFIFLWLEARRADAGTRVPDATPVGGMISGGPPLDVPAPPPPPQPDAADGATIDSPPAAPPPVAETRYAPPPDPVSYAESPPPADMSSGRFAEPALIIDLTRPVAGAAAPDGAADGAARGGDAGQARQRASAIADPATVIAQGTLIPATLETAIDSTRPGFARAVVARDMPSFDGSRILIPRGSRVVGEYRSDTERGQKRTMVNWTRLIRPDGVTIRLASPASDALGRGGIRGKVDSHFFQRFGGAILQSALGIGTNLAAASIGNGSVIIGLPGGIGGGGAATAVDNDVRPTIRVRAGTAINIFVARDLDFTAVQADR